MEQSKFVNSESLYGARSVLQVDSFIRILNEAKSSIRMLGLNLSIRLLHFESRKTPKSVTARKLGANGGGLFKQNA